MDSLAAVGIIAIIFILSIVILCAGALVTALSPILDLTALALISVVAISAIAILGMSLKNRD